MRPRARSLGMIAGIAVLVALVVGLVSAPSALAAPERVGHAATGKFTVVETLLYSLWGGLFGHPWSASGAIEGSGEVEGDVFVSSDYLSWFVIVITSSTSKGGTFTISSAGGAYSDAVGATGTFTAWHDLAYDHKTGVWGEQRTYSGCILR
jgi:hypothetical protein